MRESESKVWVVIPYFEDPTGLAMSLESISEPQDFQFGIMVVDDGSSAAPARELLDHGLVFRLLELESNQGIEGALNAALEVGRAEGWEFVARLDCGDTVLPGRFASQSAFLAAAPGVSVVGSWVRFVDPARRPLYELRHPCGDREIRQAMRVNPALTHPAVMVRMSSVAEAGHYPTDFPGAEDFEWFHRLLDVGEGANLPWVLTECVVEPKGLSTSGRKRQNRSRLNILLRHYDRSPRATWGILRALLLYRTPRSFTVWLRRRMSGQKSK